MTHFRIRHDEDPAPDTTVRDTELETLREVFIRLVPRGASTPAETLEAVHADVDLDEDGEVIGVQLYLRRT